MEHESEIKNEDLSAYQIGNELNTTEKINEWKEFQQSANEYLSKNKK